MLLEKFVTGYLTIHWHCTVIVNYLNEIIIRRFRENSGAVAEGLRNRTHVHLKDIGSEVSSRTLIAKFSPDWKKNHIQESVRT